MVERLTRAQQQARTRRRLLDAAEALVVDRGIHQTTLDEVAARAGLTKGAIYANFASKKDLIVAILERRTSDQEPADAPSMQAWVDWIGTSYASHLARPEARAFAMVFVEFWLYGMRDDLVRGALADWLRTVRDLNGTEAMARSGGASPHPADQLAALMTALDIGVAMQHLIDPEAVSSDVYAVGVEAIMGQ